MTEKLSALIKLHGVLAYAFLFATNRLAMKVVRFIGIPSIAALTYIPTHLFKIIIHES